MGNAFRTKNATQMDMNSDCGVSGEATDHKQSVDFSMITSIINKIPAESRLHVVMVKKMVGHLNKDAALAISRDYILFKVDVDVETLLVTLQPVPGLRSTFSKETFVGVCVLVFEVDC